MGAQAYKIPRYKQGTILKDLKNHPNFKMPNPYFFDDPIKYTLACVAELISPLQENRESNEVECVDLAKAVKAFNSDIAKIWVRQGLTTTPEYKEFEKSKKFQHEMD